MAQELEQLVNLLSNGLEELGCASNLEEADVAIKIAGDRSALPPCLRAAAAAVEERTSCRGTGGLLTICLGYGGQQDVVCVLLSSLLSACAAQRWQRFGCVPPCSYMSMSVSACAHGAVSVPGRSGVLLDCFFPVSYLFCNVGRCVCLVMWYAR